MTDNQPQPGSLYNSAQASSMRLNELLRHSNKLSIEGQIEEQALTVLAVYREVSPKIKKDEEVKRAQAGVQSIQNNLAQVQLQRSLRNDILERKALYKLYSILFSFEVDLRRIADKAGLLNPDKADPRLAIEEG